MPFQPAPPQPKTEQSVVNFKKIMKSDIEQFERRLDITTDPTINKNKRFILYYTERMKKLISEIPTT